ncbi:unnamed protein product [Vicia faba]|uniref:C2H2-type domain-containing protein n=1 Tax=Vicia faba TaxID=3906 RepID=A0AAV1ATN8_VICFA|nr:unnamed protein product [Vicia faba]
MCDTNHDSNKGKEKANEESGTNPRMEENQNNENKRKVRASEEEPDVEFKNNFGEEDSPFLLFGFIIDPTKGNQKAYSCNFCSKKFVTPQALGGHQHCHKSERKLKKNNETMNKAWEIFSNGNVGPGYQYYEFDILNQHVVGSPSFDAHDLHGSTLQHIPEINQDTVSRQVPMTEIEFGLVSEGGADSNVALEHKVTQEEEASKNTDLNLKL